MLNGKVVSQSLASFAAWLLEAALPGFKWLSVAWAGVLYSALYNYLARRAERAPHPVTSTRAA
jgi:hypothetical protein